MAIEEVIEGYEGQGRVMERCSDTATRIFICDSWPNAKAEAPQFSDSYPGVPALKVVRVRIEGYGQTTADPANPYTHAKITVEYSDTGLDTDGVPIEESDFGIDILNIGPGFEFIDGQPIEDSIYMRSPLEIYRIHRAVVFVPDGPIQFCMGRVNEYNWQPSNSFRNFPPQTALFEGCTRTVESDAVTGIRTRLDYAFSINLRGWNVEWDGRTGTWEHVYPPIYWGANFHDMGV